MKEKTLPKKRTPNTVVCYTGQSWVSAITEIRLKAPLTKAGFQVIQGNDFSNLLVDDLAGVEYVVIQRDFPRYLKSFFHILRQTREYMIPFIYEIDDLIFELPEGHPDRMTSYYSEGLVPMLTALNKADLVTTSTDALANYIKPFNPNIQVLPNYLIDSLWELKPPQKQEDNKNTVVVGYVGGHTHYPDLELITPGLMSILDLYGNRISFKLFGVDPPGKLLASSQVNSFPPIDNYCEFVTFMKGQEIDILLAPLVPSTFNQSKSTIKYLEYSALGIPAVYSQGLPYDSVVRHGENGLLAYSQNDWVHCIRTLVESPDLRYQIAKNAQKNVKQEWLLSQHGSQWGDIYRDINILQRSVDEPIRRQERVWETVLETQISQHRRQVKELQSKTNENDQLIQTLQSELLKSENVVGNLNAQIVDNQQLNQKMQSQLVEKDQTIQELVIQNKEKEGIIQNLQILNEEKKRVNQELQKRILEEEHKTQELILKETKQRMELIEIRRSLAWKIALGFRRIRTILAPPESISA